MIAYFFTRDVQGKIENQLAKIWIIFAFVKFFPAHFINNFKIYLSFCLPNYNCNSRFIWYIEEPTDPPLFWLTRTSFIKQSDHRLNTGSHDSNFENMPRRYYFRTRWLRTTAEEGRQRLLLVHQLSQLTTKIVNNFAITVLNQWSNTKSFWSLTKHQVKGEYKTIRESKEQYRRWTWEFSLYVQTKCG